MSLKFGLNVPVKKTIPLRNPQLHLEDEPPSLGIKEQLKADAERKNKSLKQKLEQKKAMEEDPTVFEYDGVYDVLQKQKGVALASLQHAKEERKKAKYIFAIKDRAVQRKIEQDIIYDKVQRREQEKEIGDFGETEKFVTKAYKEKLVLNKLWLEKDAEREIREGDVTQKSDLTSFYSALLTKNVALGAETEDEKQQKKNEAEQKKKQKEEEEKRKRKEEEDAKREIVLSEDEKLRRRIKKETEELEKKKLEEGGEEELQKLKEERTKQRKEEIKRKKILEEEEETRKQREKKEEDIRKMAKKNDDASIAEARKRYLARKAEREQKQQDL